jgi:Amt family ammonium transporter
LALINTGLGRSRNAAHSGLSALAAFAVAACAYAAVGHSILGSFAELSCKWLLGGKWFDFTGAAAPFLGGLKSAPPAAWLVAWMGLASAALVVQIPLGSGAERWRLSSICASAALISGLVFPLFAHWG